MKAKHLESIDARVPGGLEPADRNTLTRMSLPELALVDRLLTQCVDSIARAHATRLKRLGRASAKSIREAAEDMRRDMYGIGAEDGEP